MSDCGMNAVAHGLLGQRRGFRKSLGRLRLGLLTSAAAITVALAMPSSAQAQAVLDPPGAVPVQCTGLGGVFTCQGDLSDGLDADGPPLTNLTVNNLTSPIAPALDVDGINFTTTPGNDISLTVDTGLFGIITQGGSADGIRVVNPGDGNITINSIGNIDTLATTNGDGIDVDLGGSGDITITSTGDIVANEDAINAYANAVGRSGNISIRSVGNLTSEDDLGIDVDIRNGDVSVYSRGNITTDDDGIEVSVNDGGNVSIVSIGDIRSVGLGDGIDVFTRNGDITIQSTGNITAAGDAGIDAGILSGGIGNITIQSTGTIQAATDDGIEASHLGSGNMSITVTGDVETDSPGDAGIRAVGSNTVDTTVTINAGSTITGGPGTGDGILFQGGRTNRLNNWGTIQSDGGSAVESVPRSGLSGREEIFNFGTLIGSVNLEANDDLVVLDAIGNTDAATFDGGADTDTFRLAGAGGTTNAIDGGQIANFESFEKTGAGIWTLSGTASFSTSSEILGGTLALAGNLQTPQLTNTSGALNAGSVDMVGIGTISGNYVQLANGILAPDVDFGVPSADLIDVTGTSALAGLVVPNILDPLALQPGPQPTVLILTSGGVVTNNGITAQDTAVIDYSLLFPDAFTVVLGATVDFSPSGLNQNQTAVGETINAIQTAGGSAGFAPVVAGLLTLPDLASLADAYDQLGPQAYLGNGIATLFSSLDFADDLMSCEVREGGNVFIREGQCVWARASGNWFDQDRTSETVDFYQVGPRIAGGFQAALAPDWRFGMAFGYQRSNLDALNGRQDSKADTLHGGAVLKYLFGDALLAAAVSGGHGWYDTTRNFDFGGFAAQASASHGISHLTGRLRGAYAFTDGVYYIKPLVDLNVSWIGIDGFTESGGNGAALIVQRTDETVLSASPALEFGWQHRVADGTLFRPYVRAGVTVFDDPELTLISSFAAAPAGAPSFRTVMGTDDVVGEVAVGLDLLTPGGTVLKAFYETQFGEDTSQQLAGIRASRPF